MHTESNEKTIYFVTFIHDQSKWYEVHLLSEKDGVFEAFKNNKAFVEKQTEKNIKYLQSDNETEYWNGDFDRFLKEHGSTTVGNSHFRTKWCGRKAKSYAYENGEMLVYSIGIAVLILRRGREYRESHMEYISLLQHQWENTVR